MMRRSRISVRPNVRPGARALPSQDGQSSRAAADSTQATESEGMPSVTAETTQAGDKPAEPVLSLENISPDMKETGQSFQNCGGSDSTISVLQRRKRFSATPNLARPRVNTASSRTTTRVPKSPPPKVSTLPPAQTDALTPKDNSTAHSLRSPRWRRASGGGRQSKMQGKLAPLSSSVPSCSKQAPSSSIAPAPGPVPQGRKEKEASVPLHCSKSDLEKSSQEENPLPDPSPVCVMQSQSAKLEMKSPFSLPLASQSIPSDRERIAKLRELIKQEQRKQRKRKKGKSHTCERSTPQDHNKMTMRDLIYYLPESNPMRPYPDEDNRPAESAIPSSPSNELPEQPQDVEVEEEQQEDPEDHGGDEPAEGDQLIGPRVKVAEDGTLILDEESLTIEVVRMKGPNLAEENDPIFERGSSTTYSSFRKTVYTKPWTSKETEMFFLAISMVGTDFSLIGELFPHRARTEIKNKFKKEERENSWRIDKAFKEKRSFDLECFSKLLERILAEEERKRKKSKTRGSVGQKKRKRIAKGKKAAARRAPRAQSAEEELDSDVVEGDSEIAEKENEDCSNVAEAGAHTTAARNSRKRKTSREGEESADGRSVKNSRPEDEGALSDDCEGPVCDVQAAAPDVDRGRFRRPTPNLGARWAKKAPQPGAKSRDEDVENSSSKAGPGKRGKPRPNLTAAQRNGRAGKPKLVTLRASVPEYNEEEEQDEAHPEEDFRYPINPEEQNQAPAFVPLSLRSPQPVPMEVVETVEELEISMNVSDVVGTAESEHALCAQPVCPGAQDEVVLSTEHQLDLLVDVIEFLSPDHVAGSEESYNDAARTLLTIRNPELLSLATPEYREVVITEEFLRAQPEESEPGESLTSADQLQCSTERPQTVSSDLPVAETPQSDTQSAQDMDSISLITVEEFESKFVRPEPVSKTQSCETTSLENTGVPEESPSQERAAPACTGVTLEGALGPKPSVQNVPPGRRSRFPKPKPNLARTARTPRVTPAQCTENCAATAPVEPVSLKTVEVEKGAVDIYPKEQVQESQESKGPGEEMLSQDEAPCVGDSQVEGLGSDLSNQSAPPAGTARHLPKPSPVLDTAVQTPCVTVPLSTPLDPSTGQQPAFILALYEVSPPLLEEPDSGVDPPGAITAELLSPVELVDEQRAPAATQTESQSCDPLNVVASVKMGAEGGPEPHPPGPASEEQGEQLDLSSIRERTESSTGLTGKSMASQVDSCESGHLQVKPRGSTQNPEDPTEGDRIVFRTEHLPTPEQTPPQARSTHYTPPNPAAQNTSTEAPAKPGPSTTEDTPQGIVGSSDLPELDRESSSVAEGAGSSSAGSESQISHHALPATSDGLVTRTGRKPKGFLSFISDKSTARSASAARSARPSCPRPQVNTSRTGRRAPTVSPPPSRATAANSQTAAKLATSQATTSSQDESSSVKTSKTDEEPTSVSEYFFSDIFTPVEEHE
ncbi:hypothetical protein ANANG_G00261880 [Anguilla anguilla]|uniref:Myb-like domain-containing protein n=1 Tax=Anguilla anguilla TaxID=7936 RepID=A0A9D3LQG9_ANGAN|nr:hypothetical protein ANANG_G00261880 [Anguilla anguilla]